VQIDPETSTIFLTLKGMSLDVGAVAKGYATYQAVEEMKKTGMTNMLINMGGNIISVGKPQDGVRARWGVGVQDPRLSVDGANNILDTVYVNDIAVVSSGDYQRYYMIGGKRMHHIIDPQTLFPASRYSAVTVAHPDSALADGLSTALFIMDEKEGGELALKYGAEALWVYADGKTQYTDGYKAISKTYGGYSATDP
jgi:thiamine biosynthesis lipoprotein